MVVLVHARDETEVLAVERRGPFPVADGQCDVVQRHRRIMAGIGEPDPRAHLLGRIAWVGFLHPERGRRLRQRFDAIRW